MATPSAILTTFSTICMTIRSLLKFPVTSIANNCHSCISIYVFYFRVVVLVAMPFYGFFNKITCGFQHSSSAIWATMFGMDMFDRSLREFPVTSIAGYFHFSSVACAVGFRIVVFVAMHCNGLCNKKIMAFCCYASAVWASRSSMSMIGWSLRKCLSAAITNYAYFGLTIQVDNSRVIKFVTVNQLCICDEFSDCFFLWHHFHFLLVRTRIDRLTYAIAQKCRFRFPCYMPSVKQVVLA